VKQGARRRRSRQPEAESPEATSTRVAIDTHPRKLPNWWIGRVAESGAFRGPYSLSAPAASAEVFNESSEARNIWGAVCAPAAHAPLPSVHTCQPQVLWRTFGLARVNAFHGGRIHGAGARYRFAGWIFCRRHAEAVQGQAPGFTAAAARGAAQLRRRGPPNNGGRAAGGFRGAGQRTRWGMGTG